MSGVRVNLLPGDVEDRNRAQRERLAVGIAFAIFVLLLVVLYFVQNARVGAVEEELAQEQEELAALEADLATLQEYAELEQRAEMANATIAAALAGEASVAGVLQDLAAVMPGDAELSTMTVQIEQQPVAPQLGGTRLMYGTVSLSGQTLRGHAPGVERLLLALDKVAPFDNVYVATSTEDPEGAVDDVAAFAVQIDLGSEVLTGRYQGGLPEELR